MKKTAVCLLVLISVFSLFADDSPARCEPNSEPMNFHGRRMMRKESDFFVRQIGCKTIEENDRQGFEVVFIFSVPFDLRSIHKEEIFINEKQCSENVLIRFSKSGDALKFFIPEADIKTESGQISISLGNIKSYNGTLINNSTFEKIEIGENIRFGKMMQKEDLPPSPPERGHKGRRHHKGEFDERAK